ncbi:hypothetical protein FHG87_025681, partial [Trinorchestia longiramus]
MTSHTLVSRVAEHAVVRGTVRVLMRDFPNLHHAPHSQHSTGAVTLENNEVLSAGNGSAQHGTEVGVEAIEAEVPPPFTEITLTRDTLEKYGASVLDFKGEALTFKATSAGIHQTLSQCVEVLGQREEAYKRRLEKEVERRRRAEERVQQLKAQMEECGAT